MAGIYGNLYDLLYLPDDTRIKNPEEALIHARAVQRIMRLMLLGLETPEESATGDEELLIHLSWYAEAWTLTAQNLLAAERAATQAQASAAQPQPEKVTNLMEGLKRSIARKRKAGA
jgi:hypothetical protein